MRRTRKLLVADLFCGAGGSSTGARRALEAKGFEMELVAVNHNPVAIESHERNHPTARHYCQDLDAVHPEEIVPEGRLDLLMASPTCTYHSRARGGKPTHDQQRMDPWHIVAWCTRLRVRRILIENVPEFMGWGPVNARTGKPIRSRKGEYFLSWVKALEAIGFRVDYRVLNAANYGDATTRERFFLIGCSDGKPLVWPAQTHAKNPEALEAGMFPEKLKPWVPARDIIDWSIRGKSIFDRLKPLAPNTINRIAAGARKYWGPWAPVFLVILRNHMDARSVEDPLSTISAGGGHHGVAQVELEQLVGANRTNNIPRPVSEPGPTIVTSGNLFLLESQVEALVLGQHGGSVARSERDPLPTVTAGGAISITDLLVEALTSVEALTMGQQSNAAARPVDDPTATIACAGRVAVLDPLITAYYGCSDGCQDVGDPLDTVTTRDRFALVEAEAFILPQFTDGAPRSSDTPIGAITTTSRGIAVIKPFIVPQFGERDGQTPRVHDIDRPAPAITSHGAGALVQPLLIEVIGPHPDGGRIVRIGGTFWRLDILFRMLKNHELAAAMGFDTDDVRYEFAGNASEITRQIGNAVPVNTAAALVGALMGGSDG